MRDTALKWEELSAEMSALAAAANVRSKFGLVRGVEGSHHTLGDAASDWSTGASSEFTSLKGKLGSAASAFETIEEESVQRAREIPRGGRRIDPGYGSTMV